MHVFLYSPETCKIKCFPFTWSRTSINGRQNSKGLIPLMLYLYLCIKIPCLLGVCVRYFAFVFRCFWLKKICTWGFYALWYTLTLLTFQWYSKKENSVNKETKNPPSKIPNLSPLQKKKIPRSLTSAKTLRPQRLCAAAGASSPRAGRDKRLRSRRTSWNNGRAQKRLSPPHSISQRPIILYLGSLFSDAL